MGLLLLGFPLALDDEGLELIFKIDEVSRQEFSIPDHGAQSCKWGGDNDVEVGEVVFPTDAERDFAQAEKAR